MLQNIKKRNEGFTIIEVLIVLAIAGLIMLIVFLAVPALQRNSRNTQRSNDAAAIVGAINECLTAQNGKLGNCAADGATQPTALASYITIADNGQLTGFAAAASVDAAQVDVGAKCNSTGTAAVTTGVGARSFVVLWQQETTGAATTRCIGS